MTFTNVYIGKLSDGADPLDWGGEFRIGNTPGRIGPMFPPTGGRRDPFFQLIDRIRRHELVGKQVDWGAWAATVSKGEILAFIDEIYRDDRTYTDPAYAPHLHPALTELRGFVWALPDLQFALVASEL